MNVSKLVTVCVMVLLPVAAQAAGGGEPLLPWGKSLAGERRLPNPLGIGATFYYQEQDYAIGRLALTSPFAPIDPGLISSRLGQIAVENEVSEVNLKCDAWLLPFVNVFGLLGYINGDTTVGIGPPFGTLDIDYDGFVYGAGATAVAALDTCFAACTATWTEADLDTSGSSISTLVVMPKIGYTLDDFGDTEGLSVWIGAMYQDAEEEHTGSATIPMIGPVDYDVALEQDEDWSYLVGASVALTDTLHLEVEGGFGDRTSGAASVTLRF